jgi:hypothetical protein
VPAPRTSRAAETTRSFLPRGSTIIECQHKAFDAFDVPSGLTWGSGVLVTEHLEGDVVFVHYSHAASTSQLEVTRT